jgi:hypothetical protein
VKRVEKFLQSSKWLIRRERMEKVPYHHFVHDKEDDEQHNIPSPFLLTVGKVAFVQRVKKKRSASIWYTGSMEPFFKFNKNRHFKVSKKF